MSYIFVLGSSRNDVLSELEILLSIRAQFVVNSCSMYTIRVQSSLKTVGCSPNVRGQRIFNAKPMFTWRAYRTQTRNSSQTRCYTIIWWWVSMLSIHTQCLQFVLNVYNSFGGINMVQFWLDSRNPRKLISHAANYETLIRICAEFCCTVYRTFKPPALNL